VYGDTVLFGESDNHDTCIVKSRYKAGESVGFRMTALDPQTGKYNDGAGMTVTVNYGGKTDPWAWSSTRWSPGIPLAAAARPTGIVHYSVHAKTTDGKSGVWQPSDVQPSSLTIIGQEVQILMQRLRSRGLFAAILVGLSAFVVGAAGYAQTGARSAPSQPSVGNLVTFSASGLAPGSVVDLQWDTVEGGWVTRDYYKFEGKQGAVEVAASFEMSPQEGPVGTPVEILAKGLGWQTMESVWVLNWDNVAVGWISAVGTRGSATQTQLVDAAFPPRKTLSLVWQTMVGSRVSGTGFDPKETPIGTIEVDATGNLAEQLYRLPQLTYADDHPGNKIPALRFAYTITE
jgi:hypothetical protein